MPKRTGQHPDRALTAVRVNAAKVPGRYSDGNGLYLVVEPSGGKRWMLRTVVQGRRRDIGLGGLSLVSLAEARAKALEYRRIARDGGDPVAERKAAQTVVPTFAKAAERVHADHGVAWKNLKHRDQWINTLRTYAFPHIGERTVNALATPDVLRVLSPIWLAKPETARRVRQRMGTVFDWAKTAGYRTGDNPVEGVARGLPRQAERAQHHAALPYAEVPAFVARLKSSDQGMIARLAFEFLILTAARTGEVLGATWGEIDEAQALWIVPASRMKAGREHRVPLSTQAMTILHEAKPLAAGSDYLFPGRSTAKPMSNMVFLMALRRMDMKITAHGFRSAFRDWAAETTNIPREVAEMALAHAVENKVEAAYRRGDLLAKRRELMEEWTAFILREDREAEEPAKAQGNLRDDIPHPGVGLFVDERAKASAETAYACAISLVVETTLTEEDDAWLRKHLLAVAQHYWADYDYDGRTSAVDLRAEIANLRQALGRVIKVTDKLSADARAALRAELHRATHGAGGDPVEHLLHEITTIQAVCEPIASVQGKKGPRAQDRIVRCCERLWDVREYLTRRPFSKSLEPEFDEQGIETGRFARPDAQFVLAIMQAVDEKVTFSKVHDGLRSHPASGARGK